MRKVFTLILTCLVVYVTLEFWAQKRFALKNPTFPFGLRKNMGVDLYDAHHLSPGFHGHATRKNIAYKTDQQGFSINPKGDPDFEQKILIGGDSRAFSLFLHWQDSLAGQLQAAGQGVYLQAFPGSAPALFNYDMFDRKKIHALQPKPERVYYIYDRNDAFGDRQFTKELANPLPWYAPRRIKVALGGYFWNMINLKINSFLSKAKPKIPKEVNQENSKAVNSSSIKKESRESKQEMFRVHRPALDRMLNECRALKIPLVMVYIPRYAELIHSSPFVRDDLKNWCLTAGVDFIDLYEPLEKICDQNAENIRPYFLDLYEGIHFSPKGLAVVKKAILDYEKGQP